MKGTLLGTVASLLLLGGLAGCSEDDASKAVGYARDAVESAASDVDLPEADC